MNKEEVKKIATAIAKYRQDKNYSRNQLAPLMGISVTALAQIEKNDTEKLYHKTAIKIKDFLVKEGILEFSTQQNNIDLSLLQELLADLEDMKSTAIGTIKTKDKALYYMIASTTIENIAKKYQTILENPIANS